MLASGCAQLLGFDKVSVGTDAGLTSDAGPTFDAGPADDVRDSLQGLGVDVTPTARIDDDGNPLPDDYAPFGTKVSFGTIDEFMLFGAHLLDPGTGAEINAPVAFFDLDKAQGSILHQATGAEPPWIDEANNSERFAQTTRVATAADVDGDGIDEAVVVFVDLQNAAANMELRVHTFASGIAATPFAEVEQLLELESDIVDINVAAGDFDGDGDDDLVVGLVTGTTDNFSAKLHFFANEAGTFALESNASVSFAPVLTASKMSLRIVIGNLDHDRGLETAVVLNEQIRGFPSTGSAQYFVYDDAGRAHALLSSGPISIVDNGSFPVSVADLSIGDIDGDNLGELVLGGLSGYKGNCDTQDVVGLALDDAVHGFAILGQHHRDYFPFCEAFDPLDLSFVEVHTLDLDGDSIDEISIHGFIFDNFVNAAPWTLIETIPDRVYIDGAGGYIDRNTVSTVVGDASGDGREDLVIFSQAEAIAAYGTDATSGFGLRKSIDTRIENTQTPLHAVFIALNTDRDSVVLGYEEPETKQVFTKPVVLAAIAAPPCHSDFAQSDRCFTQLGVSTSATVQLDDVITITASSATEFRAQAASTQNETALRLLVSEFANRATGEGYTLEQAVAYTTGTQEDSVVFSSLPYDQYVYKVLSHPDAAVVGKEIIVSLPRAPIQILVERSFFNSHRVDGDVPIAGNVFGHSVGDVASYMSLSEKQALRAQVGGLEAPVKNVGQGGGATEIGLAIGNAYSTGQELEMGFSEDIRTTNNSVIYGFSVGSSADSPMRVTSGDLSSYTSSIGNLPADDFSANQYSYGLFGYVFVDSATGQEFEVVNYWVE